MAQPCCGVGVLSVLSHGSDAAVLPPALPMGVPGLFPRPHRTGLGAAWCVLLGVTGATVPGSPHVPVGKGHLHAEHHQSLGAVVPLPGQQPALAQGGGQTLAGAGAAPALAIPPAGLATPRRGSVPGQPAGPADGDGGERGWGTPSGAPLGSLHQLLPLCKRQGWGGVPAAAPPPRFPAWVHSLGDALPAPTLQPDSPEGIRQDVAPVEGVDGAPWGGTGLALEEGAPGLGQQLALRAQAVALSRGTRTVTSSQPRGGNNLLWVPPSSPKHKLQAWLGCVSPSAGPGMALPAEGHGGLWGFAAGSPHGGRGYLPSG